MRQHGAISVAWARKQARRDRLMELKSTGMLQKVYVLLYFYDGKAEEPVAEVLRSAKECAQRLLHLVSEHLPGKSSEELHARLRMVQSGVPMLVEDRGRCVTMTQHTGLCMVDQKEVWSVRPLAPSKGPDVYFWVSEAMTLTQFLCSFFEQAEVMIEYELHLCVHPVVMGEARCGHRRIAFSKLIKLS